MTGYKLHAFTPGPYGHGTWTSFDRVYTNRKSAQQARRRMLLNGFPNPYSGCGKMYPNQVDLEEVRVY